jgi:hypothetical protein
MTCLRAGRARSANTHLRRAQAYNAMNELLRDKAVCAERKLFGLIQLMRMEQFVGCPSLEALHLGALHDYIESNGGLSGFLQKADDSVAFKPIFYAGQFVNTNLQVSTYPALETIQNNFMNALIRIQAWASLLHRKHVVGSESQKQTGLSVMTKLQSLRSYADNMISQSSRSDLEISFQASATFFFCFILCMIMVEANFSSEQAINFLVRAQDVLESSAVVNDEGNRKVVQLKPKVAAKILCHVRRELSGTGGDPAIEEIQVCHAAVDAQRAFSLLSNSTRLLLTQKLADFAFSVTWTTEPVNWDGVLLEKLRQDMSNWWAEKPTSIE